MACRNKNNFKNMSKTKSFIRNRKELETWANEAKAAGGSLFSKPAKMLNGWYGCGFADPDGHKWNVFYNGK